MDDKMQRGKMK